VAQLHHPNIASVFGFEESGGVRALVMELVDGEDLSARLARGAVPLDEALPIARQIAEALEAAHEKGIVHRDLKPGTSSCAGMALSRCSTSVSPRRSTPPPAPRPRLTSPGRRRS
jgi:hypothetical protein